MPAPTPPAPTLLDTFRTLASFAPPRVSLKGAPWEAYTDWAVAQGLAPLASYNLEYRLGGGGAPAWVRDRLLSVYQGSVNDNVMKLVGFKRTVDSLEGRRLLLVGGAAFAEALYPHVAFRPVVEVEVLLKRMDVEPFAGFLGRAGFGPATDVETPPGALRVLSDGHTPVVLFADVLGAGGAAELQGVFARAQPLRVYGPSVFRPELEDALLLVVLGHAAAGYDVPYLSFVDLRELLLSASSAADPAYARPLDVPALLERARAWRLERALYTSLRVAARLFPEAEGPARAAEPPLRGATRALLERLVVEPLAELGRTQQVRGADRLRKLLTGGR
jgi:hypothetical protein